MANTTITLDYDEFIESIKAYGEETVQGLQKEVSKCVRSIEADAKKNCPVDTGRLRLSFTSNVGELEGSVVTNVEFAPYVEYGTYKQSEKPFLRPAYHKNVNKMRENIGKILEGK